MAEPVLFFLPLAPGYPSCQLLALQKIRRGASSLSGERVLSISPIAGGRTSLLPMPFKERSDDLHLLLESLNADPYDCKSLIDERLLGHFGLSPWTEPLGDSLSCEISRGTEGEGPLLPAIPKGKGLHLLLRALPWGVPPRNLALVPLVLHRQVHRGLPWGQDERGVPLRVSRASSESPHSLSSLEVERGGNLSLVHSLLRGVLSRWTSNCWPLYLWKNWRESLPLFCSRNLSNCMQGALFPPPGGAFCASKRKLEDKAEHLNTDVGRLKEDKKELAARVQQQEREVKRLKKDVTSHEEALKKEVEKAELEFPNSEDGQHYLQGYWTDRLRINPALTRVPSQNKTLPFALFFWRHNLKSKPSRSKHFIKKVSPPSKQAPPLMQTLRLKNTPPPMVT
ncbi:UNVERIFIED_CONTAM: hypothetical protein Sradi_5244600 [Sesamum radiatum]|uniref:Uncharacterized protein n=1 Tax=Sesamum radiatum TaxID=300843 RepID=A0AAW2LLD0_SESRA